MTDPDLVHRTEQALLGALIQRPRQIQALGDLTADHFADPTHQAIAASLTGEAGENRGFFGRIRGFFSRFSQARRQAEQYMDQLPGYCPDPGHLGAYYDMVSAAKAERDAVVTQLENQLAHGAQLLQVAGDRLNRMNGRKDSRSELPADVARLARTLNGKVKNLQEGNQPQPQPAAAPAQPAPQASPQPQPQPGTGTRPVSALSSTTPPRQSPAPAAVRAPAPAAFDTIAPSRSPALGRDDLENDILACMMANPDEARRVAGWLPAEVFEPGPRQGLYALIQHFAATDRAIDPVTLAWAVQQQTEDGHPGHGLSPGYVLGLGQLGSVPGTAETLGSPLLADHIYRTTVAEDWAQTGQHGLQLPGEPKPLPAKEPEPGPGSGPAAKPAPQKRTPSRTRPGPGNKGPDRKTEPKPSAHGPSPVEPPPVTPAPAGPTPGM